MKFIYFDVGGVLIRDLSDTRDGWGMLLNSLGLKDKQRQKFNDFFKIIEKKLELGDGIEEFVSIMKNDFGIKLPDHYSISDDLVNRFFYKNEGIWKIVKKTSVRYELGLLTNMYKGMLNLIRNKGLISDVDWVIVDSSIERSRKPEKEFYENAQKRSGVQGKDILFIDNKKENLKIPKELGWKTFWFDSGNYERSNKELESFLR